MAKQPAKNVDILVDSVALEDDIDNFSLDVEQELAVVTSFADAGPRRLPGNYDYGLNFSGKADFASGQSDATLFALVGSSGVATEVEPTGATAGANDPNYDSTSMVLESYSIRGQVSGAVEYSTALKGNAALTRAVS